MNLEQFKYNITVERKKRRMSMSKLSSNLRKNRSYISHLTNPSLEIIINIANAIGCSCADLMRDD